MPILGAGLSPALPLQDVCFPVQRMPAAGHRPLLDGIGEVWLLAVPEEGRLWPELTARSFILWASEQHLDAERGEQAVSDAKAWRGRSVVLPGGSSGCLLLGRAPSPRSRSELRFHEYGSGSHRGSDGRVRLSAARVVQGADRAGLPPMLTHHSGRPGYGVWTRWTF